MSVCVLYHAQREREGDRGHLLLVFQVGKYEARKEESIA